MLRLITAALIGMSTIAAANEQVYLSPEQEKVLDRRATLDALERLFMDGDLIKKGNELKEESEKATMDILRPPARQNHKKIRISMNDTQIRPIKVFPNQVTTLTITDSMGVAWPLALQPIVASESYVVTYTESVPGLLTLETKAKFIPSGMVLTLQNRLRPLQFQLESDNESLDYAVEVVIEGKSPLNQTKAVKPYGGLEVPQHDRSGIAQFLRMAPEDAVALPVVGDQSVYVWKWRDMFVIRSPYQLIDPSDPMDIQSQMDMADRVYLVRGPLDVVAFLNERTSAVINVEIVGGYR